jgi:pentatricopeptide repeat protein
MGISPNLCTYKVIMNGFCQINKSCDILGIFADMIKKVFVPDVVLYNIIIDAFVKVLKLQQALKLYHKMLDEDINPNIVTYNRLVNGLCQGDRFPEPVKWL